MRLDLSHGAAALCLLAALASAAACSKKEAPSASESEETPRPQGVQLDHVLTEQEREDADALIGLINQETKRFAYAAAKEKSNAKLFTYLAASSEDPVVIAASLQAIQSSYSHRAPSKESPDADLDRVLEKHLGSRVPEILGRALMASRVALMRPDPDPQLVETIVELSSSHPDGAGRYGILEALSTLRGAARTPQVTAVFRASLESKEPYVLSLALLGVHQDSVHRDAGLELRARALELARHADPGVRGRALALASSLGGDDHPPTLERARAALADEHPYVRAEAAQAVARLADKASIHLLVTLLDDAERSVYSLRGFQLLDGRKGNVSHRLAQQPDVRRAAMAAIAALSDGQLELEPTDRKRPDASLDKNIRLTRVWYAQAKASLPQPTLPKAPSAASAAAAP